jgi:ubiquitin C-terminal hydrolase
MRSSLTCKTCKLESTTFDTFSHLPISLPEPTQQTLSIIIYRIPNRIKDILNNRTVRDEAGNLTLQILQG